MTGQVRQIDLGGQTVTALVTHSGTILADGGTVVLTASAVDGLIHSLVTAGGVFAAQSVGAHLWMITSPSIQLDPGSQITGVKVANFAVTSPVASMTEDPSAIVSAGTISVLGTVSPLVALVNPGASPLPPIASRLGFVSRHMR